MRAALCSTTARCGLSVRGAGCGGAHRVGLSLASLLANGLTLVVTLVAGRALGSEAALSGRALLGLACILAGTYLAAL